MARSIKQFPEWNPQKMTLHKFNFADFETRYKALRHSSSGFIQRKDVRDIILKRDNYKCAACGNENDLQIDHIVSVRRVAIGEYPIRLLNIKENLQILCGSCNARKLP